MRTYDILNAGPSNRFMANGRIVSNSSGIVQVQNLVKATKEVEKKYDLAMKLLKAGDYDSIKKEFSSPIDVACAALRPLFRAPSGKTFIVADLASIEARGSAWVAGCDSLMSLFRDNKDAYVYFACLMDPSLDYDEAYKRFKAGDKKFRNDAKPPMLGCFGKNTLVVTSKGLKPITEIDTEDDLWDGEEWVKSDGCVDRGYKETIDLFGVRVTSDHKILTEEKEWKSAWEISNTLYGKKAIRLANGSFKKESFALAQLEIEKTSTIGADVLAERNNGFINKVSNQINRIAVMGALEKEMSRKETEFIKDLVLLEKSLIDLRIDIIQFYRDAGVSGTLLTAIKDAELRVTSEASMISWSIVYLFLITISSNIKLIEKIITEIMKEGTCALFLVQSMEEIKKSLDLLNTEEKNYLPSSSTNDIARYIEKLRRCVEKLEGDFLPNRLLQGKQDAVENTYDIANCGPRNRYTIVTKKGPLIVHNCCYGLTPGEIAEDEDGNTVKTGLLGYASAMGIELPLEYAVKAVEVYRNSFPEVVNFWWDLHRAFVEVTENGGSYQIGPLTLEKKGRVLAILLPSGRSLHYINPQVTWTDAISKRGRPYKRSEITIEGIDQKTHQWMRIPTRGAKLFENVVQALCRDILAYGMIEAKKMGFEIVLTCHDEIVAEVPEDGNLGVDQLVQAMIKPLSWCPGFLIGAEGYATDYYRKE